MSNTTSTPAVSEDQRSHSTQRIIDAPRGVVFEAIGNPERLARWWGPRGFRNTFIEFDFQEGGQWRFTMQGPDGKEYPNESVFSRIIPGEMVLIEHHSVPHFLLEISLLEEGKATLLKWRQIFDTEEQYQRLADIVSVANEQNIDRLAEELMRAKGSA